MCGIAGIVQLRKHSSPQLLRKLAAMNALQEHRGPDGEGIWTAEDFSIGLAHRRLSIIDLDEGTQPMEGERGNILVFNGEIYNYLELKEELKEYPFRSASDSEIILAAYERWGRECVLHLRGMFAFALWDSSSQELFLARDPFGIKPLYYTEQQGCLYFASEVKALIPFMDEVETDLGGLKEYLSFQFCLEERTLFKGVHSLPPAHHLVCKEGRYQVEKYWEVYYEPDFNHTRSYFEERLREVIEESIQLHTRSDVPVGAYVSGGIDSSLVASVAARQRKEEFLGFTGKFTYGKGYDESEYARALAHKSGVGLHEVDITAQDFLHSIDKVIYHLDYPVAGPGSFPQYHVSKLASGHRKVVLGGQGGDEIFGGYTRYLIAYFEQCIKAAIEGTMHSGNFVVTYESIIPNLRALRNYKPLMKEFWKEGLFEELDRRYYRLVNRARNLGGEIRWEQLGDHDPFGTFQSIFHGKNVGHESYFDCMTHFDFKTLLRALLHVEDRMSMAHGLESRVPLVDRKVVELAATMPADIKFQDGTLKMALVNAMKKELPAAILNRKDKMGFPVPLNDWLQGELRDFVQDLFRSQKVASRPYFNQQAILKGLDGEGQFGRKVWGLLSLEIWHRQFHDRKEEFRKIVDGVSLPEPHTLSRAPSRGRLGRHHRTVHRV